ncbi:MAG: hypothetical protein H7Y86_12455 [Rhizobacter sp.]|nr:hypothetical protein [Ferruginibacter sp.]
METNKGVATFYAKTRKQWRSWLEKHSAKETEIYLILHNKKSTAKSVTYPEAVEEALCFGWIDSFKNKRDDATAYQRFSPRKANSNWSPSNIERATRMTQEGLMTPAGQAAIDLAKERGRW